MPWAHSPVFTCKKGLYRVACTCAKGWQYPLGWTDYQTALDAYKQHVGLKEREPKIKEEE